MTLWSRCARFATLLGVVSTVDVAPGGAQVAPGTLVAPRSIPEERKGKSYVAPALEIIGFDALLNLFDRLALGSDYRSNFATMRRNLRGGWVIEDDPYLINQFGHPYQGSIYHGFARSAGLNFWESLGYTFAGSALWEIAGETTPPSVNDQVASGVAGSFMGEALFRVAQLLLENARGPASAARERSAAVVSPPSLFNRRVGGRRFDRVHSSRKAAYYRRLQLGAMTTIQSVQGPSAGGRPGEAIVEASMEYGLPGQEGYTYTRPFDYFAVQATASSVTAFESILTRGLLAGRRYASGSDYRGVWGLYGSYDYIAPQLFRVSSTALSLGTTGQWWLAPRIALQGSAMGGVGFAAVGTNRGDREGDYQYGLAPQALLAARLIATSIASLDVTAREYYVSGVAASTPGGHDNIARADAALTLRLWRQNAVALRYQWSRRDAFYPELGRRRQERGTLGLFYTLLGHDRFGATEWR
jgi:hypothetical protein